MKNASTSISNRILLPLIGLTIFCWMTDGAIACQRFSDSRSTFFLKLDIDTEDNEEMERPYLLFTYLPDNQKYNSTRNCSLKAPENLKLPASTSQVIVVTDNYAPALVCFEKKRNDNERVQKSVTLHRGVEVKFRVTNADGSPVEKAHVRPRAKLGVGTEFSWKAKRTNKDGEATIRYPAGFEIGKASITKRGFSSTHVKVVADGKTNDVQIGQYVAHKVKVLDSENQPLGRAKVYMVNRGLVTKRNMMNWKTDKDGTCQIDWDPKRPFRANLLVESGNRRGIFSAVELDVGKTVTLKLPPPRTIKLNFTGELRVLQGKKLQVSNGYYDSERHQYILRLPYHFTADKSTLTVHGVLDGWLAVSAVGEKGNYFWSAKIEDNHDEINIDLNQFKKHTRKFRFAYEHDGKSVQPQGFASFYVRSPNKNGERYRVPIKNGSVEIEGEYTTDVRSLRMVHQGLIGFALDSEDNDITMKLTPVEELEAGSVEKFVFPVVPAGRIVGTVLASDGKPVAGKIKCEYRYLDKGRRGRPYGFSQSIKSDAKGRFDLSPVPMDCDVELHFGELGNRMTKVFIIDPNQPVLNPTIRLPETESASIQVSLPTGKPANSIPIEVFRKDDTSIRFKGRTNKNGVFYIPQLATGMKRDYQYQVKPSRGYQKIEAEKVSAGDAIEVKLNKGHRIFGRISNKFDIPVSMMIVEAVDEKGEVVDTAYTDARGKFEFTRLPDKPVRLRARHARADAKMELSNPIKPDGKEAIELKAIDNRPLAMFCPLNETEALIETEINHDA